ncbi:Carnosine synthase 1 protein [Mycena sanguinolenta]|uniref:Carnosine synthase 1 protein n=1 Tax=Mycena sanguinolenta TaxID=230812 RepID=A0A8H6X712_9AGAR|nr:Carnosine synthase 1 protein [Mycena sanguinolenta]
MNSTTLVSDDGALVEAIWRMNAPAASFQTVDIILQPSNVNAVIANNPRVKSNEAHRFLMGCIQSDTPCAVKLVLSTVNGFIGRLNFFERRFLECDVIERAEGLAALDQKLGLPGDDLQPSELFPQILSLAAAGILLRPSTVDDNSHFERLESELTSRLALTWVFPALTPHRNIVLIEGYSYLQTGAGFIQAVRDLNVSVIVLGTGEPHGPKHWLQNPENAPGFCDAFIPIDMNINDGLPGRIVDAVRSYKGFDTIDGILTAHDRYLVSTAKAAVILGLPASPIRAHEIATDKYAMREFEVDSQGIDFQFLRFSDLGELEESITAMRNPITVNYPAIVKPVSGYLSEGVARVSNDAELFASVGRIDTKRHGRAVIVETYIDGPEFDANIVLCEGEILFFELVDDFPSAGDKAGAGAEGTFFETSEFTPSNLPNTEREIVRSSLHRTLLDLGFTWGLFHVEGRVKDSTMEFRADESGIVDLRARFEPRTTRNSPPSCFLVEINARIPGLGCAMSTMHTYGVDFYAAHLLSCLRDAERLRLVTTPFDFPQRPDGSQYFCEVVFIQPERGGRFNTQDPCGELLQRHPELQGFVSYSHIFWSIRRVASGFVKYLG